MSRDHVTGLVTSIFDSNVCLRGLPRPLSLASRLLRELLQLPACFPDFDGSSLPRSFPTLCLRCARSRASNLATIYVALQLQDQG